MFQFAYSEIVDDTSEAARAREREAIEHSIELLEAAETAGPTSEASVRALSFLRQLWTLFIDDLAKPENQLPEPLRADLISIGLFILKEVEQIQFGKSGDFRGLIDISASIKGGLV